MFQVYCILLRSYVQRMQCSAVLWAGRFIAFYWYTLLRVQSPCSLSWDNSWSNHIVAQDNTCHDGPRLSHCRTIFPYSLLFQALFLCFLWMSFLMPPKQTQMCHNNRSSWQISFSAVSTFNMIDNIRAQDVPGLTIAIFLAGEPDEVKSQRLQLLFQRKAQRMPKQCYMLYLLKIYAQRKNYSILLWPCISQQWHWDR